MSTLRQAQLLPKDEISAALQAIEWLTELRTPLRASHGINPANPLVEVRAEWEEDVDRVGRGET